MPATSTTIATSRPHTFHETRKAKASATVTDATNAYLPLRRGGHHSSPSTPQSYPYSRPAVLPCPMRSSIPSS